MAEKAKLKEPRSPMTLLELADVLGDPPPVVA